MNGLTKAAAGFAAAVTLAGLSGTALAAAGTDPSTTAGAASAASSSPSSDSPTPAHGKQTLAAIQQKAAAAISRRLASLGTAIPSISGNAVISAADKATLLATLNGDVAGLTALGTTIAADTTVAQAATDYKTIFTGFRVYALALPQVHFAAAADALTGTVLPKLTDAQSQLAALLAGVDSGKNTPAVQAAMADLATQISAATAATAGLSATVLGYTPAQYDANHALLSGPRASLKTASTDVKSARADVVTVTKALA